MNASFSGFKHHHGGPKPGSKSTNLERDVLTQPPANVTVISDQHVEETKDNMVESQSSLPSSLGSFKPVSFHSTLHASARKHQSKPKVTSFTPDAMVISNPPPSKSLMGEWIHKHFVGDLFLFVDEPTLNAWMLDFYGIVDLKDIHPLTVAAIDTIKGAKFLAGHVNELVELCIVIQFIIESLPTPMPWSLVDYIDMRGEIHADMVESFQSWLDLKTPAKLSPSHMQRPPSPAPSFKSISSVVRKANSSIAPSFHGSHHTVRPRDVGNGSMGMLSARGENNDAPQKLDHQSMGSNG